MAGLSMGRAQTFATTLTNLDRFAYIGGFSGNCGGFGRGNDAPDMKIICGGAFADAAAFNAKAKVLFLGIGAAEGPGTKNFSDALMKAGVHNVRFKSPETAGVADLAPRPERLRAEALQVAEEARVCSCNSSRSCERPALPAGPRHPQSTVRAPYARDLRPDHDGSL